MLLLWNLNPEVQLGSACDCERLVDNCVTVTLKQANRAEPSRTGPRPDTRTRTSWTGERRLQWLGRFSFLLLPRGPVRSSGSGSGPSAPASLRCRTVQGSALRLRGLLLQNPAVPLFVFIRERLLLLLLFLLLLLLLLLLHLLLILLFLFRLLPSCVSTT